MKKIFNSIGEFSHAPFPEITLEVHVLRSRCEFIYIAVLQSVSADYFNTLDFTNERLHYGEVANRCWLRILLQADCLEAFLHNCERKFACFFDILPIIFSNVFPSSNTLVFWNVFSKKMENLTKVLMINILHISV